MVSTKNFYDDLEAFSSFVEVTNARHYSRVPEDWNVIISDVKGSTKAIAENRYKEVNMAGAATITAVLNALSGRKIPFVFGGDGATFLVHDFDLEAVAEALKKTATMVKTAYDLEIRIGIVSIATLTKASAKVELSKYRVSKQSTLAMIRGGGVAVAEKWIKEEDSRARKVLPGTGKVDVTGLSCRWNPIPAKRGEMLSILVLARGAPEVASETYELVLGEIENLLESSEDSVPVSESKLDRRVSLKTLLPELKLRMKTGDKGLAFALKIYFGSVALRVLFRFGLKAGGFDAKKYVRDLASNTDFRKFDDMLRMIRDCDAVQKKTIVDRLEELHLGGRVFYGIHGSKEALMTCMVFSTEDHVHFIDGAGGGYAMAAKQLKGQMASDGVLTAASPTP
jgi:hypothetical protein